MTSDSAAHYPSVVIDKLVYQGWGMGSLDGFTVFVPGAYPGDTVEIDIYKRKRSYGYGSIVNIVTPSPYRDQSDCPHFNECGGCQIRDISYENQLILKHDLIQDACDHLYAELKPPILPIIASDHIIYHRNKMDFSFGINDNKIILGLKKRGSYKDVVPVSSCLLEDPEVSDILSLTMDYCNTHLLSHFSLNDFVACADSFMIRHSKHTDTFMIMLTVREDNDSIFDPLLVHLADHFDRIESCYICLKIAQKGSPTQLSTRHILGSKTLKECFSNTSYLISPLSFFQTNSHQANRLYSYIRDQAGLRDEDIVFDLYCGTGTIGLFLADKVAHVYGVDENDSAIEDAKANARLNNQTNITFFSQRVKNFLKFTDLSCTVAIIDPPRSGMVPKALKRVIELNAKSLIYVSCNPTTLLRDLKPIIDAGYTLTFFQPFDMFPHTFHIEIVVILTRSA